MLRVAIEHGAGIHACPECFAVQAFDGDEPLAGCIGGAAEMLKDTVIAGS